MTELRLEDDRAAADFATFVGRALRVNPDGALRLQAAGEVLACWVEVLPGRGLMHSGLALALRVQRLSGEFSTLSVWQQQQRKRAWEDRNLRRGLDPAQRHAGWLEAQDLREFERRREERRAWFANLAEPLRQAYATSWDEHRRRYGYATSVDASSEPR